MCRLPAFALILLASLWISAVHAKEPAASNGSAIGRYSLSGQTDVGSELYLREDGSFSWMLMYGNEDHSAKGSWKTVGKQIILTTASPGPLKFQVFANGDYNRTKMPKPGIWVALVGVPHVAPVADVEVKFVAKSGKSATGVSQPNGDAIVDMPSTEVWARAGLRANSTQQFQWFDVPADRAPGRIAGFAITNPESLRSIPFRTLALDREPGGLKVVDSGGGFTGTYVKSSATD